MPNIRTKGQSGEREVQKIMNDIVIEIYKEQNRPPLEERDLPFQRNQNQSAVGGSDLSNPFALEIEVKRQEALSIGSWWKQCVASAERTGGVPILIFRQSRQKWRVIMFGELEISVPGSGDHINGLQKVQVEISLADFKLWWRTYFVDWLKYNSGR